MSRTRKIALHGIFLALIIVSAKISLPVVPPVPFTLQSAVVILCGLVLGWQSAFTVAIYIILGLIGAPVFAMGGGIGYVFYPTFGFTLGFLFSAIITGLIYKSKPTFKRSVVAVCAGTVIIYVVGIVYYLLMQSFYFGTAVDIGKVLLTFYVMFIPSDILKGVLCVAVASRLKKINLL